jgi:hypothetical protein
VSEPDLAQSISADLRRLTGNLAALLREAGLADARRRLLDCGVEPERTAHLFVSLRVVLSDPADRVSDRLGLGRANECDFCGRVPEPVTLVNGRHGSICDACALTVKYDGAPAPTGTPCSFCELRAVPGGPVVVSSPLFDAGICHECADLALEIVATQGRDQ